MVRVYHETTPLSRHFFIKIHNYDIKYTSILWSYIYTSQTSSLHFPLFLSIAQHSATTAQTPQLSFFSCTLHYAPYTRGCRFAIWDRFCTCPHSGIANRRCGRSYPVRPGADDRSNCNIARRVKENICYSFCVCSECNSFWFPEEIIVQKRLQILEGDLLAENRSACTVCQNPAAERVHLAVDFREVLYVFFSDLFEILRNSICCRKRFAPAVITVGERTKDLRNSIKPCVS